AEPFGVEDQRGADGDPGGNRNAALDFHNCPLSVVRCPLSRTASTHRPARQPLGGRGGSGTSSEEVVSSRLPSASSASAASGPSTSRSSSVPWTAARSISSSGLLPLTRWSSLQTVTELW